MRPLDRARPGIATLLAAGAALGWCKAAGVSVGFDPMLVLEIAGAAAIALWAALVGRDLRTAKRLQWRLNLVSSPESIDGVAVRVIRGGQVEAFVLGILRPTVYLGAGSIAVLDHDELAAVVHHEDHHRRTLAPLRAAALEAWLRIVGRSSAARALLLARLAQLETAADAYAMQRGVHPGAIAAALIKVDPHRTLGTAFSGTADRRIQALVDAAAGRPAARTTPLPYEWLPLVIVIAVTVGCHLTELATRI